MTSPKLGFNCHSMTDDRPLQLIASDHRIYLTIFAQGNKDGKIRHTMIKRNQLQARHVLSH